MFFLHFAYIYTFLFSIPAIIIFIFYRIKFYKYPIYVYPLTHFFKKTKSAKTNNSKKTMFLLRSSILIILALLMARPQWVDKKSNLNIEGIDIALAIDVSGSMQVIDDLKDKRNRMQVAKDEAIRFIEKRTNDPIAIVIFAKDTISRCPLTLDKNILKEIVGELEIGYIEPEGTSLGTGLATAVNRLRKSKAKSKIIILLTDGQPTPEKIDPEEAIDMAKQFGIKVYTIGIGNEKGGYVQHPIYGLVKTQNIIDTKLLQKIAQETGGMFFRANNPAQMRKIYDTIDRLEKTKYQTDIFNRYYEAFYSFIWILLLLIGLELFLKLYLYKRIGN